jgi:phospholipid/cholesterol/gamma-HCH transport system substrate-binding protein
VDGPDRPDIEAIKPARQRTVVRFAAVGGLVCVLVAVAWILLFSGGPAHHYTVQFANAGQLVKGDEVYIGGVPRGSVDSIERSDNNLADIGISIDQTLHEGTTATIRQTSQVGVANRYVSLAPGPNSAPAIEDGLTISVASTEAPVDIDALFDSLNPKVRRGLSQFIQGNGTLYTGAAPQANQTYHYFAPALSQTNLVLDEVNSDRNLFESFIVNSSKLVTSVSQRSADLSSGITNARTAFDAIGQHTQSLDRAVHRLPDLFHQGNETFATLRSTLTKVDPLIDESKPATRNLGRFASEANPVFRRAVPVFKNLGLVVKRDAPHNDARELLKVLPEVERRASGAFPDAVNGIHSFEPTLDVARAYTPDILGSLAKLGAITGYYDANGHYARVGTTGSNLFDWNSGSGALSPIASSSQYDAYGPGDVRTRCPGGATQSAPDSSNPFVGPTWPGSFLSPSDCDVSDLPPGP